MQAFILVVYCKKSYREAGKIAGLSHQTVRRYCQKVIADGFDIVENPSLSDQQFEEGKSTRCPHTCTTKLDKQLAEYVRNLKTRREVTLDMLGHEFNIVRWTVVTAMKKLKMWKVKPTKKPKLMKEMMAARLKFFLEHKN